MDEVSEPPTYNRISLDREINGILSFPSAWVELGGSYKGNQPDTDRQGLPDDSHLKNIKKSDPVAVQNSVVVPRG